MTKHTTDRIKSNGQLKREMIKSAFDNLQAFSAKVGDKKWDAATGKWVAR
jgi:hypothetical protein